MDRREFLKIAFRWIFTSLSSLMFFRLIKGRKKVWEVCRLNGLCNQCGILKSCSLPTALSRKKEQGIG